MVFFDFLDDDEEEERRRKASVLSPTPPGPMPVALSQPGSMLDQFTPYRKEEARRRAIKPVGDIDTDPQFETRVSSRDERGMVEPDRSAFLQKKNASDVALRDKAIRLLQSLSKPKDPRMRPTEDLGKYINELHSPGAGTRAAEIVNKAIQALPNAMAKNSPEFKEIVALNRAHNELLFQDTGSNPPGSPYTEDSLRSAEKKVQEIRQQILTEPLEEQRKFLESQLGIWSDQAKELKSKFESEGKERLDAVPSVEEKAAEEAKLKEAQKTDERGRAITGDDGTPGRDSIFELYNTLAPNGRQEFASQAKKALDKIGKQFPFLSPFHRVAFYAALPVYAEALGAEAYNRVIKPFAGIDKEQERFEKTARGEQQKQEEGQAATREERKGRIEEARNVMRQIADLDVMNTPIGVIGFILTSLVLGPRMASFLFSRSASRGKLEGELKLIVGDIRSLREREQEQFKMGQEASGRALDSAFKYGGMRAQAGEGRESALQSRALDHYYRMQEIKAQMGGRAKDDPAMKELDGAFTRQVRLATRAEAKIASSERKIAKLQEQLSDPMTAKDAKRTLYAALEQETKALNVYEGERADAEDKMKRIDKYMRDYGVTAGVGAESGGSGAGGEE